MFRIVSGGLEIETLALEKTRKWYGIREDFPPSTYGNLLE
jgi:hypothetical protein